MTTAYVPPIAPHFDVVVVGSGFGGAVTAYRAAEAGLRVCLLERGRAYPPGSFPRTPSRMARNFWDPGEGLYGLYDVWSFRGLESVVSSGLGGGSLIYANVLLRKDARWFVDDEDPRAPRPWPVTRADLDPHYARAERMLGATPYPFAARPYSDTPKTRAMADAARALGRADDLQLPPLAVTFGNDPDRPRPGEPIAGGERNVHGAPRLSCVLCGECDAGCNYGSKNSLDYNYVSRAQELGAEVLTLAEVRTFAPRPGGGWTVRWVRHDPAREGRPTPTRELPPRELTCAHLVLSAGTFGTTYLMLRNRAALPVELPALGSRFCGNGDLLTFAFGCTSAGGGPRALDPSYGPVITSALRVGDALDGAGAEGRGFYVEDAGIPAFMTWLVEATDGVGAARRALRFGWRRLLHHLGVTPGTSLGGELAALLGPGTRSAGALPLLGMGRDVPDGELYLAGDGSLENTWTTRSSMPYFVRMRAVMRQMAEAWGAREFRDNPLWWLRRVVTVHPLGGCPMGHDAGDGVVDAWGEVFGCPGLHVADGSVLPGPVGANPSLTIAALADRFADRLVERAEAATGAAAGGGR